MEAGSVWRDTPAELKARIQAERSGAVFLVYRDGAGGQRILPLGAGLTTLTVGRDPSSHVSLDWDPGVSWLHAELAHVGSQWTLTDDGLSRNGTFVNGERVVGRRRLRDHDVILCGSTRIVFRSSGASALGETQPVIALRPVPVLSPAQRRVLVALCRPSKDAPHHVVPATNQEIAAELVVSVDAVKANLRALFDKFEIEDLPQNRKRSRLVALALTLGVISPRDL